MKKFPKERRVKPGGFFSRRLEVAIAAIDAVIKMNNVKGLNTDINVTFPFMSVICNKVIRHIIVV